MYESCLQKQKKLTEQFLACTSDEAKYEKIIELGRKQKPLAEKFKTNEYLVSGCQSQVFLHTYWDNDKLRFDVESDALISAGLAALLTSVYSGESPEVVLKCSPSYLDEIGVNERLTPNRSNGLYSIHLRMKQDALKLLVEKQGKEKH